MRFTTRPLVTAAAALAVTAGLVIPGSSASGTSAAPVQPYLQKVLNNATTAAVLTVMVHAKDIQTAKSAVSASGLTLVTTFDKIGVAVARGTQSQVTTADHQPGVTYLEGNQPIRFFDETSNTATRGSEARDTLTGANGTKLDGTGVSVAVIDSGVDPTHPFFKEAAGSSAVVRSLKSACADESSTTTSCIVDLPTNVDTDTLSGGGHGTHVNGIIAGRDTTLTDGTKLHGAAPGAKLVDISTGAVLVIIGADAALNWVLENHAHPCGAGVSATACPPIKVSNNSYGPMGGGEFDPQSATAIARGAGGRRRYDRLGQRQRRRQWPEPVEPARPGPDAWRHLRRVLQRPGDRHPRRCRVRLQLTRRRSPQRDVAGHLRPR